MKEINAVLRNPNGKGEYRCHNCNKLLLKGIIKDGSLSIKCPRCGEVIQLLELEPGIYYISNANIQNILQVLKSAFDNASEHIVITDANGIIFYANKSAEIITGFEITEMLGKKAGGKDLWGGLMPKVFYKDLWKTLTVEKRNFTGEITNKTKKGDIYKSLISISPILDDNHNVVNFIGIERPITSYKDLHNQFTSSLLLKGLNKSTDQISTISRLSSENVSTSKTQLKNDLDNRINNLKVLLETLTFVGAYNLQNKIGENPKSLTLVQMLGLLDVKFKELKLAKNISIKIVEEDISVTSRYSLEVLVGVMTPLLQNLLILAAKNSQISLSIKKQSFGFAIKMTSKKQMTDKLDIIDFNYQISKQILEYFEGNIEDLSDSASCVYSILLND